MHSVTAPDRSKPRHWAFPILVTATLTAIVTLGTGYYWYIHNSQLRELTYRVTSTSNIFPKDSVPGKQVEILIDKKPIGAVSVVNIALFNTSDQDYDDLPIVLDITSTDGKKPKVLQATYGTQPGMASGGDV